MIYKSYEKCYTIQGNHQLGSIYMEIQKLVRSHESEETYLEVIFDLKRKKSAVYSIDVVEALGYAKSSVSRGVNLLKKKELITIAKDGEIQLTKLGENYARAIEERHIIITKALQVFDIDFETAEEDACRIEHVISEKSFLMIKSFLQNKMKI